MIDCLTYIWITQICSCNSNTMKEAIIIGKILDMKRSYPCKL